ncbi:adenylate/guanylate cyclase domain-containing protein [Microbaculum marinisediminis]|uniref:AAA family ATPase n=1 Tax=Microbaculum marinisediminis TaxID=2931392 RepID=A0AAW5R3D4_9HYPH|nr:adenylate/guanylate cyclase domain-containing protein [Microbaculum sp. A6E488]MCT8974760.1 AAA family ATPase [Microbaculum sp. A6E488]
MQCAACGADNKEGGRFCAACGAALAASCPACGAPVEPGDRFCGACGGVLPDVAAAAAPAGEMRPVTVLFSDLSGFTELSNRIDPEATGAILDAFFEIADGTIARHGGTVDKHIGDCTMGVFGAPVAHADDARRAVAAAVEIRQGVARLAEERRLAGVGVHSGVANGMVMAAASGSGVRRDYTVIGPSVNLAARLCDAAGAGEILVSGDLVRLLAGDFDLDPAAAMAVAGFDAPVAVARVRAVAAADGRPALPLVGRRRELRQAVGLLADCLVSRAGQVVYVRGDAGIGKTRLVEAIEERARADGFRIVKAGALDFGAGRRQDAARVLVKGLLGISPDAPQGTAAEDIEAAISSAVAAGAIANEDRVFCAELTGETVPDDLVAFRDQLAPETRRRRRADLMGKLAAAAGRTGPHLIVLEDVHWADDEVLAGIGAAAAAVSALPVALLLTGRPDDDPVDHGFRLAIGETPLSTIDLGPLSAADAADLARAAGAGGPGSTEDLVRRAEGNPLFLVQLAHHIGDLARGALPTTIQSLVFARLDRLSSGDKATLQVAAILGNRFALDDLRTLAEDPRVDPAPLVSAYLLRLAGEGHQFAHALIREAVYESLPPSRRTALHQKAAALFADRDRLLQAEHLERAEDPAAAALFLDVAGDEMRLGNFARALSLNARGLAIAEDAADRFALTEQRGEIALTTGDVTAARAAFEDAERLAGDEAARCRAEIGIVQCLRVTDALAEAEAMLERAEARALAAGLTLERARIHHLRGNLLFPQGRIAECLAEHETALALAREAGSADVEVAALGGLGDANYAIGRMRTARDIFADCIARARASGLGRVALAYAPMLALMEMVSGDPEASRKVADEALRACQRAGAVRPEMICRHSRFIAAIEAGDVATARAEIDRAEEIAASLGATRFQSENRAFLSWALRYAGDRAEALRVAREGRALSDEASRYYMLPVVLGQVAASSDDAAEVEAAIAEARDVLSGQALSHCYSFFYRAMIEADIDADLGTGRAARVVEWADALDAATAIEPCAWTSYVSRWGRAMAACAGYGERPDGAALATLAAEGRRIGLHWLAARVPAA